MRGRQDHTNLLLGDIELKEHQTLESTWNLQREVRKQGMDLAETRTEKLLPGCLQHPVMSFVQLPSTKNIDVEDQPIC
ncbi:uncharacterized protein LOC132745448 isoform X2 [Ruditapes philippinarum]|uniref:uncharacterized protein LOC132745448 isoform X2 n=1 Tax=Ruditapes philippinarum TaxID=129788 RepID=UPI00295BBBA0|nr:uncharacterized protein LOC132745448 isoform X2 [Ruditapes philippinarum]